MQRLFEPQTLGTLTLANRFIFPPIKTAYGTPKGNVTDQHLTFYRQLAHEGPGLLIVEPVSVTAEGKEHPKQICVHLPESADELKKIVDVIHSHHRLACLHLNHGGAAANPKATGTTPKAPFDSNLPDHRCIIYAPDRIGNRGHRGRIPISCGKGRLCRF